MDFKRKITENVQLVEHMKDGDGTAILCHILKQDEMFGKGRVFAHLKLEKGCGVGCHRHDKDCETYYILKGRGKYLLNGEYVSVEPGDVLFVDDGNEHEIYNEEDEPLEMIALVLYTT